MFFKPDEYHQNVSTVDWEKLKKNGYEYVVFDIDNTLDLPDKETKLTIELQDFIKKVDALGFNVLFMSNNTPERVNSFVKHFSYPYLANSHKPFKKGYLKLLKNIDTSKVIFVGDKIVTDVIGGNRQKGYTILVDPLTTKKKYWYTKFMNGVESIFRSITGFKKGHYYE